MIEFTKAYQTTNGITFASLEEAQSHEINVVCSRDLHPDAGTSKLLEHIVANIVSEKDKVIDILSTTANSRPKARKANGGTKKRKSAPKANDGALADML